MKFKRTSTRIESYYIIQEYQSAYDKWVPIGAKNYGIDSKNEEFSSYGECYQKTGVHGTFKLEYALEICNKLNKALKDGSITNCFEKRAFGKEQLKSFTEAKITEFKVFEVIRETTINVVEVHREIDNATAENLEKLS